MASASHVPPLADIYLSPDTGLLALPEDHDNLISDVRDSLADISRAADAFGYAPAYTLNDGLKETIQWFARK